MVQWLVNQTLAQGMAPERPDIAQDARMMTREEHAQKMRELHIKSGLMRAPRRGWSLTEYQGQQDGTPRTHAAMPQSELQTTIPEHAILRVSAATRPHNHHLPLPPAQPQSQPQPQPLRRPGGFSPPRRSQSVTDKEPEPVSPCQPSGRLNLLDLPSELHYAILDFLDPIDGVCFGLAHSRLYGIHRRKNGTVSLSSRYSGPNDREWAWRSARGSPSRAGLDPDNKEANAGAATHEAKAKAETDADADADADVNARARARALAHTDPFEVETLSEARPRERQDLRLRGQIYCRKCGTSRCELHRHLREWFGAGMEYCEVKQMYGAPAGSQAKSYCYMPSPKNPHRCGRHGAKRVSLKDLK